jgi:hypothetical protein
VTTNREVFEAIPKAFLLALLPTGGIEAMSHSMKPGVCPCFKQPLNRGTGVAIAPFEGKAFRHLPVILQHAQHVGVAPLQVAKDWPWQDHLTAGSNMPAEGVSSWARAASPRLTVPGWRTE